MGTLAGCLSDCLRIRANIIFMYGDAGWRSDSQGSQADLSAPTQAPTRYAEVGNVVDVGDEECHIYLYIYISIYIYISGGEPVASATSSSPS
jgi:hypothetical protein